MIPVGFIQKTIETKQGEIAYFSSIIDHSKPAIVLLHGLSSNHSTWNLTMRKLHDLGWNVIALDLRGHGFSDKTRKRKFYSILQNREDISSILKAERIQNVFLVGYSWGGSLAIDYAVHNNKSVKGLVLVSTSYKKIYSNIPFLNLFGQIFLIILGYLLSWQKREEYHYFNHENSETYWTSTFSGLSIMPISVNFWMLAEALSADFKKEISKITFPTLILYGSNDAFVSKKDISYMQQVIPNSKVICIESKNHYLAGEQQEAVSSELINFFKTLI